jgi:hypothetical protein
MYAPGNERFAGLDAAQGEYPLLAAAQMNLSPAVEAVKLAISSALARTWSCLAHSPDG